MKAVPNIKIKSSLWKMEKLSFYQMIFERATNIQKSIISLSYVAEKKENMFKKNKIYVHYK